MFKKILCLDQGSCSSVATDASHKPAFTHIERKCASGSARVHEQTPRSSGIRRAACAEQSPKARIRTSRVFPQTRLSITIAASVITSLGHRRGIQPVGGGCKHNRDVQLGSCRLEPCVLERLASENRWLEEHSIHCLCSESRSRIGVDPSYGPDHPQAERWQLQGYCRGSRGEAPMAFV